MKFTGHAEQRGGDSRSPYGERGLKSVRRRGCTRCLRRSPYGERGLKFPLNLIKIILPLVALLTESVD